MSSDEVPLVQAMTNALQQLLQRAGDFKSTNGIEPLLTIADFGGDIERISSSVSGEPLTLPAIELNKQGQYATIETAFRNIFYDLLASTSIHDASFKQIWNLLDIVAVFSDNEQCEPGLIFWLIEELLDSQTIDGCRKIFDYLESRRERITAKHFKQKNLIILRSCNELLRRLSRAEDTVFCGRVFIFLFQSFPLGDKSSVNLRGEFHLENTTTFDVPSTDFQAIQQRMDIDMEVQEQGQSVGDSQTATKEMSVALAPEALEAKKAGKTVSFDELKNAPAEAVMDTNALYRMFWTLQEDFSNPTRLFESESFDIFKKGLNCTIQKFKDTDKEQENRGSVKTSEETRRGLKRKRGDHDEDLASNFNPKYLTSRDLFDLEISDLAFRRHILVQVLILVDFLLSLTSKAKAKLSDFNLSNKSVLYGYTLSEEDTKWAIQIRSTVADYLQQGPDGKFYYRMVDTVLSRDKNWVRWKAENCPPIERPPISAQEFLKAKSGVQKATANKRLRPIPLGSIDLTFLSDAENVNGLEKLKQTDRYSVPSAESFQGLIADDDFDIDIAKTEEDKSLARNAKASKMWRMLRIASKNKLNMFEKIDDGNNFQTLFKSEHDEDRATDENGQDALEVKIETAEAPATDSIQGKESSVT
ncbi:MAG: hypothetical protein M1827_005866 [Pycnora praestabilis]|nr:MAG: hypothetical protein M1827_005866 [Pycnora praestabilis]